MTMTGPEHIALFFELLPAFEAVARKGGVAPAAKSLNVSPATISNRLRRLESTLGLELFIRQRRTLELSPDGTDLLRRCERWFQEAGEYVQSRVGEGQRAMKIGAMGSVDDWLLFPALQRLSTPIFSTVEHPTEGDMGNALLAGTFDVCIGANLLVSSEVERELLCTTPLGIYVGPNHPLFSTESVTLEQALEYGFVVLRGHPLSAP
ncbi:MAG: LysR family transcriptional regulator, partial [Myxococcota bacterium]